MSQWGTSHSAPPSPSAKQPIATVNASVSSTALENNDPTYSPGSQQRPDERPTTSSRPMSMIQTYQPPVMEVSHDTLPELQRIFTFLNSHSNKLYQEGYFLKFHDTDTRTLHAVARLRRTVTLTVLQAAVQPPTESGKNALPSLSVRSCPCGMQLN
jgi:CCR4-NOT transcriptional complex subunit CAF120